MHPGLQPASSVSKPNQPVPLTLRRKAPDGSEPTPRPRNLGLPRCPSVSLPASPYHPALNLFTAQKDAQACAELLGAPWIPFAFACGYLITNGWHFHDTEQLIDTFCPVPHECLETIQDIVTELQKSELAPKYFPIHISQALRDHPVLAALKQPVFDAVCQITLMRISYPPFSGKKDDWLTVPAWALRMPKRRARLS